MNARRVVVSLVMSLQAASSTAWAAGLVVDASRVTGAAELRTQIAAARATDPQTFARVAGLKADADVLFSKRRGGVVAPMGRTFKQLGAKALLPMLEVLAFEVGQAPATDGGQLTLAVGLLEAVGALQDARSAPVLEAILGNDAVAPVVTRAAADAYGFLQTDAVAAKLVALAQQSGPHARAVREGMGSCRRVVVANALGEALAAATDVREQVELSRALGDIGNAWAWQTPGVTARAEEGDVRLNAARALVSSYMARTGEARQAASNALLVVGSTQTPALINAALARATPEQRTALNELSARFERNPVR